MHPIAKKYVLFGESSNVTGILLNFHKNYESVLSGLAEAWRAIQDPPSKKDTIAARLAEANSALSKAKELGLSFYAKAGAAGADQSLCPFCSQNYVSNGVCRSCGRAAAAAVYDGDSDSE